MGFRFPGQVFTDAAAIVNSWADTGEEQMVLDMVGAISNVAMSGAEGDAAILLAGTFLLCSLADIDVKAIPTA